MPAEEMATLLAYDQVRAQEEGRERAALAGLAALTGRA